MSTQQSGRMTRARMRRFLTRAKALAKRFKNAALSMRTLVSVCGIAVMLVVFCGAIMPVRYDIAIGMVPRHTITANRDVVDEVTTEALRTAGGAGRAADLSFCRGRYRKRPEQF